MNDHQLYGNHADNWLVNAQRGLIEELLAELVRLRAEHTQILNLLEQLAATGDGMLDEQAHGNQPDNRGYLGAECRA